MRVIAGKYAKQHLFTLKSRLTRPTSDKVKEALFDILGQFFNGEEVLDLYGGSGALGIEAVSRGCRHATIVDRNYNAVQFIRRNVRATQDSSSFTIYKMLSEQALKIFKQKKMTFDLVFLDPPYAKQHVKKDMARMSSFQLLKKKALVAVETDAKTQLPSIFGFHLLKNRRLGRTRIRIYRKEEE